jgi:hypothetical protein
VSIGLHIVSYSFKARNVELQRPAVTGQRPVSNNRGIVLSAQSLSIASHATMKYVMPSLSNNCIATEKQCFLRSPCRDNQGQLAVGDRFSCEGWFEYFHRSPASRTRRRKGNPAPGGYNCGTLFLEDKYGGLTLQLGDPRIWDSKIWPWDPWDSDPKMTTVVRTSSNCKRHTRPLVRDCAPHQHPCNCLTITKIRSWAQDEA